MNIKTLQAEMISAMKSGDKAAKQAISCWIAAVKKAGIDQGCRDNIPDSVVDAVLLKEKKSLQESIDTCPTDREADLAKMNFEMTLLNKYAPQILTDPQEIENFITEISMRENILIEKKNRGAIMKFLKGKVDMKVANSIIEKLCKE